MKRLSQRGLDRIRETREVKALRDQQQQESFATAGLMGQGEEPESGLEPWKVAV